MKKIYLVIATLFIQFLFVTSVANWKVTDPIIKESWTMFPEVFIDKTDSLWINYLAYKSEYSLNKTNLVSNCFYKSEYIWEKDNVFIFSVRLIDNCKNPTVSLYFEDQKVPWSKLPLNVVSEFDLYNYYTDFSDSDIQKELNEMILDRKNLSLKFTKNSLTTSVKLRKIKKYDYKISFLENIIEKRKEKYLVPVAWKEMPTNPVFLPNSWRPYRSSYTDWIHHWWDIYANYWTDVIALDDWIIINVVSWFTFDNFDNVDYHNHDVNTLDENLNILRWNQIWLKTMKWDVVFYAHLSQISPDIKIWSIVSKNQTIWKIWTSGVPDKNYKDIHLHFSVQKNPRDRNKYWKYTFLDIMSWNWYFKWESPSTIIEKQKEIFN